LTPEHEIPLQHWQPFHPRPGVHPTRPGLQPVTDRPGCCRVRSPQPSRRVCRRCGNQVL